MESLIPISELNDFVFCPRSIYFHHIYAKFNTRIYHDTPQKKGNIAHENIDEKKYSTSKKWLQSIEVSSKNLGITGKIDLYNEKAKELVERKRTIKTIYDGYKLQVWAQALCLEEMGYGVEKIFLHSLTDNKRYEIEYDQKSAKELIQNHITAMKEFSLDAPFSQNSEKCKRCIYAELCDIEVSEGQPQGIAPTNTKIHNSPFIIHHS